MGTYVFKWHEKRAKNRKISGGKGAQLAILAQSGFLVPPFFIISTRAYGDFLRLTGLRNRIDEISKLWNQPDRNRLLTKAAELKVLIRSQEIPVEMRKEILQVYTEVKSAKGVAVRSSATYEDLPRTSAAGQQESFLDVRGEEELLQRIKDCWASLWTEAAIIYRTKKGISLSQTSMAIVVQEMVHPQASGIIFTRNPRSGSENEFMIEAAHGPGVATARGITNPDNYVVSKEDLSIKERIQGERETPRVLTDAQIKELARLAVKVEKRLRSPQDIEWSFANDQFLVLQSRPITSLFFEPPPKEELWTEGFFEERFPQPVSPLGWSLLKGPVERRAFLDPLWHMGYKDLEKLEITRLFYGRPYTNVEVFRRLYRYFPKFLLPLDVARFFPSTGYVAAEFIGLPLLNLSFMTSVMRFLLKDKNWLIPLHLRNWNRFVRYYLRQLNDVDKIEIGRAADEILVATLEKCVNLVDEFLKLHRWSITFAEMLYRLLNVMVERWCQQDGSTVSTLVSGLQGNKTVAANIGLWKLSCIVNQTEPLKAAIFQTDSGELFSRLRTIAGGEKFIRKYQRFINIFGHRANSLDVSLPLWEEDREFLLSLIKSLAQLPESQSPVVKDRKRAEEREKITQALMQKLSADHIIPVKCWIFKAILRWTQAFVVLRENQRFYWQMSLAKMRKLALELGRRLVNKGFITQTADIFLLNWREVTTALKQPQEELDLEKLIAQRKKQTEENARVHPPSFLRVINQRIIEAKSERKDLMVLQGIGVSPGLAVGKAVVLKDLRDHSELNANDILIASSLDPGWTPILAKVSGVALEVGGYLSHGSILAREFGVPAVVNLRGITQKITSGQEVILDGFRGTITIKK